MGRKYKKGETYKDQDGNTYTIHQVRPGIDSRYSQITYEVSNKATKTITRHTTTATKFTRTLNGRKTLTMTATQKNQLLAKRINLRLKQQNPQDHNIVTAQDAKVLRLAETTLQRWAEQECGDSNDQMSWAIERDEQTNVPYMVRYHHTSDTPIRTKVQDREASTLKRVQKLTASLGLHFYHQTDPRGCSLYVSNQPLNDQNYTNGVVCSV